MAMIATPSPASSTTPPAGGNPDGTPGSIVARIKLLFAELQKIENIIRNQPPGG